MPYVAKERRNDLAPSNYSMEEAQTAGELNFQITDLISAYVEDHGLSYASINEAIGILECAKLELYRRVAAAYEDKKIKENGDVYPPALLK